MNDDVAKGDSNDVGDVASAVIASRLRMPEEKTVSLELVPGGHDMRVTNSNKQRFVSLQCRRVVVGGLRPQIIALRSGLFDVVERDVLSILSADELGKLVCGDTTAPINVKSWQEHCNYAGGYSASSAPVRWFWKMVETDMNEAEKRQMLLFWSGSSHPPLFGFDSEAPGNDGVLWTIQKEKRIGGDSKGIDLPRAATCDRAFRLPGYQSYEELVKHVKIAIEFGTVGYHVA